MQIRKKYISSAEAEDCLASNEGDHVYAHGLLFFRDALLLQVFRHAVKHADPGIILRVLKYWCFSFKGAGSLNYCRETMEILIQWNSGELTPEMSSALEKTWFYNRWGAPGRYIPSDLYIEQLNYYLKVRSSI